VQVSIDNLNVKRNKFEELCKRILVMITFIPGLGGVAKAEGHDGIIVTLPFKFVVGGKILPAGTYTVGNAFDNPSGPLMITNHESSTSVLVLPYVNEGAFIENPELDFQRGWEEYFLRAVRTAWRIYRPSGSQSALTEAAAALHNNGSSTASSGSE
jgi:hypothetical protein